jgi:hypothetical protein
MDMEESEWITLRESSLFELKNMFFVVPMFVMKHAEGCVEKNNE